MKKSTTAMLFSALLFPGAGHVFLKRYVSAAIIGGTALIALYLLFSAALAQAQKIADKILTGEIPAELSKITEAVLNQPGASEAELISTATNILIACWLIGIADSFRVGRAEDSLLTPDN